MKNTYLMLFLLSIFSTISFAQNWSPVNLSDKYNFQNDTADHITNTIWVNSVEVQGLDSVFYLNRIVKPCPECPGASNNDFYYKVNQGQFLQKEIRKESEDKYVFAGENPFTIFPNANLNESWLMDTLNNIEAMISNVQAMQLFDNQDSVKTIALSSGDSILLSKNHGVVYFPEIYEGSSFDLVGIEGRDLGELVPKFVDFYDFEVGDVFQYDGNYGYFPAFSYKHFKLTILDKEIINDTIRYECTRSSCTSYPNNPTDYCSYDIPVTLIYIDDSSHFLNGYPHQLKYQESGCYVMAYSIVMLSRDNDGKLTKRISAPDEENPYEILGLFEFVNDTSEILQTQGFLDFSLIAKENLGIIKHHADPFEGCVREDLIGYIKNGDTTGIIYPDSSYIVSNKEVFHDDFTIYPNPTNDQITLDFKGNNHGNIDLQIFDALGKKVSQQLIGKEETAVEIDLKYLPKGVYFLKGKEEGSYFLKKIVRH